MSLVFHREDPPRIVILLLCCLVVSTGTVLAESSRIIGGHDSKWNVPDIGKPGNVIFSASDIRSVRKYRETASLD